MTRPAPRPILRDVPCTHPNATRGIVYEYCPDCGAVRTAAKPDRPAEPWHTCELCRIGVRHEEPKR